MSVLALVACLLCMLILGVLERYGVSILSLLVVKTGYTHASIYVFVIVYHLFLSLLCRKVLVILDDSLHHLHGKIG